MLYGNVVRVRYLGATGSRSVRLSATLVEGGMDTPKNATLFESRDMSLSVRDQGARLARKAIAEKYEIAPDAEAIAYGDISANTQVFIF